MPKKAEPLDVRFWRNVKKTDSCWQWVGNFGNTGYGRLSVGEKGRVLAHRYSYMLHFGEIPDGACVCHTCDNRECVNPDHFFLGTRAENLEDMTAKGRRVKGESHGCAKLSEDIVREIRKDTRTQRVIAEEYGLSQAYVGDIKLKRAWRHVDACV